MCSAGSVPSCPIMYRESHQGPRNFHPLLPLRERHIGESWAGAKSNRANRGQNGLDITSRSFQLRETPAYFAACTAYCTGWCFCIDANVRSDKDGDIYHSGNVYLWRYIANNACSDQNEKKNENRRMRFRVKSIEQIKQLLSLRASRANPYLRNAKMDFGYVSKHYKRKYME